MAANSSLRSCVSKMTTCPICLDDFKDPRSLPCVHSFCLQCLQGHCKDKCIGDDVHCPVCRKEIQIPQDGLEALPRNFFLQNLVDAKTTKHEPGTPTCEPCSREGRTKTATMYCVDCSQKLCDRCYVPHKNWSGGPHDVRAMGDELSTELTWLRGSYCDKHPDKRLELYCFDCRCNVCMKCFAVSHQHHKCEEIEKVARNFVASIQSAIKPFSSRIAQLRQAVKNVELARKMSLKSAKKIEQEVQRKGKEMKRLVDDHVRKLLQKLEEVGISSDKETNDAVERFELALITLESFESYSCELSSKGSACDITRAANDIHVRAEELLKTHVVPDEYRPTFLQFIPTSAEHITGDTNAVGSILRSHAPQVIHTFPDDGKVWGLTLLNSELYVLRQRDTDQVDVYSTTDFTLLRRLNVHGLSTEIMDITSSVQKQCVYILSDCGNTCVHRVGLDESVSKWQLATGKPLGMSVTPSCNLLITSCDKDGKVGKLLELSSEDGKLLREITLQSAIQCLQHSVQLISHQYLVCHDSDVSLVGSDGTVIRNYSGDEKLHLWRHMAVDDNEFIFVADSSSRQIVLFDPSLSCVYKVVESTNYWPMRLCFDNVTRRLSVGQDGGIVSIVQM